MNNEIKETVLIYAPVDGIAGKILYIFLRAFNLTGLSLSLPFAIIYYKNYMPESSSIPFWGGILIAGGIMFWSIIFIGLEQYSFPLSLKFAYLSVFSWILNAFSGTAISSLNIFYGAYQIVMGGAVAQFLFIGFILFYSLLPVRIKKFFPAGNSADGIPGWYNLFLVALVFSIAAIIFFMRGPIFDELFSEPDILWKITGISAFIFHVISDMRTIRDGSLFADESSDSEIRNNLHNSWAPYTAAGLILSLMFSGLIALWDMK